MRATFRLVALAMTALASASALAVTVEIGGTRLEVPTPPGFALLTRDLGRVYEYQKQFIGPQNEQFAIFIPEADVPIALRNEIPELRRSFRLQVSKKLVKLSLSGAQFAEFRTIMRKQNEEFYEKIKTEMPGLFDRISKGASETLGSEVQMSPGTIVPLPAHEDSARSFASSMFVTMQVSGQGGAESTPFTFSATSTLLHVKGKVLFLYCYGTDSDLVWTRDASRAWAAELLRANPSSLAAVVNDHLPAPLAAIDWSKVLGKALAGAVAAALIGAIALLRRRRAS